MKRDLVVADELFSRRRMGYMDKLIIGKKTWCIANKTDKRLGIRKGIAYWMVDSDSINPDEYILVINDKDDEKRVKSKYFVETFELPVVNKIVDDYEGPVEKNVECAGLGWMKDMYNNIKTEKRRRS